MSRRIVVAACRWYRFVPTHPNVAGALHLLLGAALACLSGVVSLAWGDGWWPGVGVGVVVAGLGTATWALFVLGVVAVMRMKGIGLERFLDER